MDKLVLLPQVQPPGAVAASTQGGVPGSAATAAGASGAAATAATLGATRAHQLQAARARTEVWAEVVQVWPMYCLAQQPVHLGDSGRYCMPLPRHQRNRWDETQLSMNISATLQCTYYVMHAALQPAAN